MRARTKPIAYMGLIFILTGLILTSCTSYYHSATRRHFKKELQNPLNQNHFTGIFLMDAGTGDTLFQHQSDRYFTPASNVKIATLFTALELLPEHVPALRYTIQSDTLFFSGTGDPSFLHPYFQDSTALKWLTQYKHLVWHTGHYIDDRFGPGWAWEDFPYAFSTERSEFPVFGNTVQISAASSLNALPEYFSDSVTWSDIGTTRWEYANQFRIKPPLHDTLYMPIRMENETVAGILESLTGVTVQIKPYPYPGDMLFLPGYSRDSLCRKMMVDSDNFLAEQLMVLAATQLGDTLSFANPKDRMLDGPLADLDNPPRWVDGSGLSRYNLFTPKWIGGLLHMMYRKYPKEDLFQFFAEGGKSGTLAEWYASPEQSYVYAKSGSLGNNYNLSGFLIADSGKTVIFSMMNNHFRTSNSEVKRQIESDLRWVKVNY